MKCSKIESMREFLTSQHKSLKGIYEHITRDIELSAQRKTTMANNVLERDVCCRHTNELITRSPSDEYVLEIPQSHWERVFGDGTLSIPALYFPMDGKIYLQKDEWCLCNFAHEALHSRSVLSRRDGPFRNLKFVYEGTTELLTGWLLQVRYEECYGLWSSMETCFLEPYSRSVKMWNYFSYKIGLKRVIELYLDCGLTDPLRALIDLAREYGIKNVFSPYDPDANLESRFMNELSEAFGTDFDEYMASDVRLLRPGKL